MRVSILVLAIACGARTDLEVERSPLVDAAVDAALDAPGFDARPDPPDCGDSVPVGQVRASVDAIHARVAIGDDDNLYTARRVDDAWLAVSLDPCLEERWATPVALGDRTPRGMDVSVADDGTVWLIGQSGLDQWAFSSDGDPRPGLIPMGERRRDTWIGLGANGPIYSVFLTTEEKWLVVTDGDRFEDLRLPTPSSFVWDGECAVFADAPTCWNIGFRFDPLDRAWLEGRPRLIDGTLRNIVPPAFDGRRMWSIEYGISTYELVAVDVRDGDRVIREPLMRTSSGQTELLLGSPVIAEDGSVILYRHGSGVPGALEKRSSSGELEWTASAPRVRRGTPAGGAIFSNEALHLVGRGGLVYLAVGASVYALELRDGSLVWRIDGLTDLNESAINLHRNGDLYVLDRGETLHAIVTASAGLAPSPWPIPGGNARLSLSR